MRWGEFLRDDARAADCALVLLSHGIPHALRRQVWRRIGRQKAGHWYEKHADGCAGLGACSDGGQILLDIDRTFPQHATFAPPHRGGREQLYELLCRFALQHPAVAYCQGMSYVAAVLLLGTESPRAAGALLRWAVLEGALEGFYRPGMEGMLGAAEAFGGMLVRELPALAGHLAAQQVDVLLYATQWFLSLFTTLRDWEATLLAFDPVSYTHLTLPTILRV